MEDYNSKFQVFPAKVDNLSDQHLLEAYMGGLKEDIKHDLFLKNPENDMEAMEFYWHIQGKNRAMHKTTTRTYAESIDWFAPHRETIPRPTQILIAYLPLKAIIKDLSQVYIIITLPLKFNTSQAM